MSDTLPRRSCEKPSRPGERRIPLSLLTGAPIKSGRVQASRNAPRRAAVLITLNLLMIAHLVHWLRTGRTLSPIEPSESMRFIERGELNAGFIFFAAAILATMVFGRFVCGWGCHVVALQDFCGWIMKKCGVRPQPFRSRLLGFVPLIAALYMFVWPMVYRWIATGHAEAPTFTNRLMTDHFWDTFPPPAVAIPFLLICGFGTVYFLGAKGFCTYACPYGGFFGLAEKAAVGRIRVTDACHQCGHCTAVCTSNVRVHEEVRDYGMVVDPGCMRCMDCVSVCPNDALYFGFGPPAMGARQRAPHRSSRLPRFSIAEDVGVALVFAMTFFAVRGVYDAVPFLMALGSAAIAAVLAHRLYELWLRQDVSLQSIALSRGGRFQTAGVIFALSASAVLLLVAHCGWIRWNEWKADRAFARIEVPEEAVLLGQDLKPWMTRKVRSAIDEARTRYHRCDERGLLASGTTQVRLAWLALIDGDYPRAAALFANAARRAGRSALGGIKYNEGCALLLARRPVDAVVALAAAVANEPGLTAAHLRQGEAFAQMNDLARAEVIWRSLLDQEPRCAAALHNLAGAARVQGRLDESASLYLRALAIDPQDAETHFQLGLTLTRLGREYEAGAHFAQAIAIDPRYGEHLEPVTSRPALFQR